MAYYRVPTTNKVIQMLDKRGRLEKVIDLVFSLPASPAEGDRYIDLTDNKVKEWNGSAWDEYTPKEGDNLYVLNRDKYYYFDGSEWKDVTEISSYWEKDGDTLKPKNASNVEIAGSFIGDGSQLTGIKKLIEEFVAQGNVTAGDIVAFVNGKVKKGKMGSTKEIEGFGNEYVFNSGETREISCSVLNGTKFVICYQDKDNFYRGTAIIGEVNGTTITFGSEYVFEESYTFFTSCSTLDEDKFVVCYQRGLGDNGGYAIIGKVNGTTITFGNKYVFSSEDSRDISCCTLSNIKFVVCYSNYDNSRCGTAIIGEVNGTTITFGNKYVFSSSGTDGICSSTLNGSKFVVCYNNSTVIGEVSGNTITFGSEYVFDGSVYSSVVSVFNENKFVVCYFDSANAVSKIGEVNGTTITFGNKYVFNTGTTNNIFCSVLNEDKFVVCYRDYGNNKYGTAVIGEVSGNTITFGSEYVFNEDLSTYICCTSLAEDKFVVCYGDLGNNGYGTAIIGKLQQNEYNYIGISQETKSDGETVKVLIQGLSDVHSGLTVGQKYYATPEGDLTTDETEDYLGLAIAEDKLLLMDWQRPIMLYDEDNDEYVMPE